MSDEEWARWKGTFTEGGKPMPNIVKRAASDRRRALVGVVGIFVIAAGEAALAIRWLTEMREPTDVLAPAIILVTMTALCGSALVSMGGTLRETSQAPLALLDALEKRHEGRRKLMRGTQLTTALLVLATMGTAAARMAAHGRFNGQAAAYAALVCAATIGLVWWVHTRTRRTIDRELREVEEARKLLSEGDVDAR